MLVYVSTFPYLKSMFDKWQRESWKAKFENVRAKLNCRAILKQTKETLQNLDCIRSIYYLGNQSQV